MPQNIAVLDLNELDFLDQLQVPVKSVSKIFIPEFLQKYKDDQSIVDLGSLIEPNVEKIYLSKPDLILGSSLQNAQYTELNKIAPTIMYDIDYQSGKNHMNTIQEHFRTLGKIFNKANLAEQKIQVMQDEINKLKKITEKSSDKALVIMHNNGLFSNFGINSRYGFIFKEFGVKPASDSQDGQTISSEFIHKADPDIIFIIDRTAVMERKAVMSMSDVSNPLLKETRAWKNGQVVFVYADAWYSMGASPSAIKYIIKDIISVYP